MNVETILRRKGRAVVTVPPDATVADAAAMMAERHIGALVISPGDGEIDGILSERDIVYAVARQGRLVLDGPVGPVMTRRVVTCSPEDSIESLMGTMTRERFRHLPVVAEGRLAGMISIGDVVKHRLEELETEASALREFIAS